MCFIGLWSLVHVVQAVKSLVDLNIFVRLSGAGLMYGAEGDWVAWLYGNLILVLLGNIIGGGVVVGTNFSMLSVWYKITNTDGEGAAGGFAYLNFDWTQHSKDLKKDGKQVAVLVQKYLLTITNAHVLTQLCCRLLLQHSWFLLQHSCSKNPAHRMHSIGH